MASFSKKTVAKLLVVTCVAFIQFALLDAAPKCRAVHKGTCPILFCPIQLVSPTPGKSTCTCDSSCPKDEKCCNGCGTDSCRKPEATTTSTTSTTTTIATTGSCPVHDPDTPGPCDIDCSSNAVCNARQPGQLCCSNGCGRVCMAPV